MTDYSIDDAKRMLPELIARAQGGEGIVLTQDGAPVAELKPVAGALTTKVVTPDDVAWLEARRSKRTPLREDSARLIDNVRDEGEH